MKKIIIAIDGYSSSGKSTMAKDLAREIGYHYIDSGAMYRAVTLYAMRHGMIGADGSVDIPALVAAMPQIAISFEKTMAGQHTMLNGEDVEQQIRTMEVSSHVSPVSAIKEVRAALVKMQQELGAGKGIVMDGRDIGTVVFPNAELKIFVDASAETRAQRRYKELLEKGTSVTYEQVLENVKGRDFIDSTRKVSPLRRATDAIALDNSQMTREQQLEWLLNIYQRVANA
ncbi:MAG: (d)CMP kinase [Bacteroidales bacterium]|nr:(d)CMP kinase [Bacteroidales bacterium]